MDAGAGQLLGGVSALGERVTPLLRNPDLADIDQLAADRDLPLRCGRESAADQGGDRAGADTNRVQQACVRRFDRML